jgi:hypothetical protein
MEKLLQMTVLGFKQILTVENRKIFDNITSSKIECTVCMLVDLFGYNVNIHSRSVVEML